MHQGEPGLGHLPANLQGLLQEVDDEEEDDDEEGEEEDDGEEGEEDEDDDDEGEGLPDLLKPAEREDCEEDAPHRARQAAGRGAALRADHPPQLHCAGREGGLC